AAFLASGAWMPRRPTYDGVPPAFQSFEDEWKHFGSLLLARFGVEAGGDAYAQARWEAHASAPLFADTRPAVAVLADAGYRLGVLSDADDYLRANLARHDLRFDAVVTSLDVRCYKPHRLTFEAACAALDV